MPKCRWQDTYTTSNAFERTSEYWNNSPEGKCPQNAALCQLAQPHSPGHHVQHGMNDCLLVWHAATPGPLALGEEVETRFQGAQCGSPGGCCLMGLFCLTGSSWEKHSQAVGEMAGTSALANSNALLYVPACGPRGTEDQGTWLVSVFSHSRPRFAICVYLRGLFYFI